MVISMQDTIYFIPKKFMHIFLLRLSFPCAIWAPLVTYFLPPIHQDPRPTKIVGMEVVFELHACHANSPIYVCITDDAI